MDRRALLSRVDQVRPDFLFDLGVAIYDADPIKEFPGPDPYEDFKSENTHTKYLAAYLRVVG